MHHRIRRLEQALPHSGCPACRDRRGRIVMVDSRRRADGTPRHPEGRLAPCERCGQTPEFIIQIVETVVNGAPVEEAEFEPTRGSLVGGGT